MTTQRATLQNASFRIGEASSVETGSSGRGAVVSMEFNAARPVPVRNSIPLEELSKRWEANPDRAARLAAARANLPDSIYPGQESLAVLRLRAGFSQAQLAEAAQTSQPHIARIEAGRNDPSTGLICRVASALKLEPASVFRAILAHRTANEAEA